MTEQMLLEAWESVTLQLLQARYTAAFYARQNDWAQFFSWCATCAILTNRRAALLNIEPMR